MKWGKEVDALLEMQKSTGITPLALQNKPVLSDRLSYIFSAFLEMHQSRRYSEGGPQPLGFTLVLDYAKLYDLSMPETRWLWSYIREIDMGWFKAYLDKRAQEDSAKTVRTAKMQT